METLGAELGLHRIRTARDHEWAVTACDVLRRRTTLAMRGHDSPDLRTRVDALLAQPAQT
jgi:glycerol-3-phosphate dehydrogenase